VAAAFLVRSSIFRFFPGQGVAAPVLAYRKPDCTFEFWLE
jgi:hypothetical protein